MGGNSPAGIVSCVGGSSPVTFSTGPFSLVRRHEWIAKESKYLAKGAPFASVNVDEHGRRKPGRS